MTSMVDEFEAIKAELEASRPPQIEIWISSHVPDRDESGEEVYYILDVGTERDQFNERIKATSLRRLYRNSCLDGTEKVILLSERLYWEMREEIDASHIPVFRLGCIRVWPAESDANSRIKQ